MILFRSWILPFLCFFLLYDILMNPFYSLDKNYICDLKIKIRLYSNLISCCR